MKKNLLNHLFFLTLFAIITCSCKENFTLPDNDQVDNGQLKFSQSELNELKEDFSFSLAKSLKESKKLREIIKSESLNMIDEDYNVIYLLIKDLKVENGIRVKELIESKMNHPEKHKGIETILPTLAIFVPRLPMNSFSAESWDTENQIPVVALPSINSLKVSFVNSDGKKELIDSRHTPSFPVVVVKESIRVTPIKLQGKNRRVSSASALEKYGLEYIDDAFNRPLNLKKKNFRMAPASGFDAKVINAWNVFGNSDNWQRDHVYYSLTPTVTDGDFDNNFTESITTFQLSQQNTYAVYNFIADQQDDPKHANGSYQNNQQIFWYSGAYIFRVRSVLNGKDGIGERIGYINAMPWEVFDVQYNTGTLPGGQKVYVVTGLTSKQISVNVPIVKWDLKTYPTAIKISIEEVDQTATSLTTETNVATFAGNFEISGTIKKIGLKLGLSASSQQTMTVTRTVSEGSDILGDVVVYFADKIIVSETSGTYKTQEYSNGMYTISVEPLRTQ